MALLETVWVMESRYDADPSNVAAILADLLDAASLEVQDATAVRAAVLRYASGGVDLHDCLIVSLAHKKQNSELRHSGIRKRDFIAQTRFFENAWPAARGWDAE